MKNGVTAREEMIVLETIRLYLINNQHGGMVPDYELHSSQLPLEDARRIRDIIQELHR